MDLVCGSGVALESRSEVCNMSCYLLYHHPPTHRWTYSIRAIGLEAVVMAIHSQLNHRHLVELEIKKSQTKGHFSSSVSLCKFAYWLVHTITSESSSYTKTALLKMKLV